MKINMFEGARRITKLIAVIWIIGCSYNMFTWNPYIDVYFRVDSPESTPIMMSEQENGCHSDDTNEVRRYSHYTTKGTNVKLEFCFKPKNNERKTIPIVSLDATELTLLLKLHKLSKALRQAHQNGNTEDAKKLAQAYVDAKATATSPSILRAIELDLPPPEPSKLAKFDVKRHMVFGAEKYSSEIEYYTKEVVDNFKLSKVDEDLIDGKVWAARWEEVKESALWSIGGVAFLYIFTWCMGWIIRGFAGIPLGQDRKPDN